MAQDPSFDIVSEVDMQEVDNAVNQAIKEMLTRFDFRGSKCTFELDRTNKKITIFAEDEMKLRAMQDMLTTKAAKRNIAPKAFKMKTAEPAIGGAFRQEVELVTELPQEVAKEVVRLIKESKVKVQAAIQGGKIRVTGKKIDDLQFVQHLLREKSLDAPLQFTNYKR